MLTFVFPITERLTISLEREKKENIDLLA